MFDLIFLGMKQRTIIYVLTGLISLYQGIVFSQPTGYYNGIENLKGNDLLNFLNKRISNHKTYSYDKAKEILAQSDTDPLNAANVICVYTGRSQNAFDYGSTGNQLNREHVWAKSHGDFGTYPPAGSDVHNLKPSDASVNSSRSNKDFDECSSTGKQHTEATECYYTDAAWEPGDKVKGDIARIIFYMATRYKGENGEPNLTVVDALNNSPNPWHGKLSTLLLWNRLDPPDAFERRRNEVIFGWQQNRNPYIDYPFLIDLIWENKSFPTVTVSNMVQLPLLPEKSDTVEISANISSSGSHLTFSRFIYGNTFSNDIDTIELQTTNGIVQIKIPPRDNATHVYYRFEVSDGTDTLQWYGNYKMKSNFQGSITPIRQIQGNASSSVYDDQVVSTAGIVTSSNENGFYLQNGAFPWSGIYVFAPNKQPFEGDSVIVTGMVDEYYTLTEIKNLVFMESQASNLPIPQAIQISTEDMKNGSSTYEQYEGVLVKLNEVKCISLPDNYGEWKVSQNGIECYIVNSPGMFFTPELNTIYNLTGIATHSYSNNKLELRTIADITIPTAIKNTSERIQLEVYPNPVYNQSEFIITGRFEGKTSILLSSVDGKIFTLLNAEEQEDSLKCSIPNNLPNGFYVLSIQNQHNIYVSRIVISTQ